jgi:ATP-dependent DNA helicase DinG
VAAAFAPGGPLASSDPAYRPRAPQERMAVAVGAAIDQRATLVVEAGTGVGKTFAYLVPLLLSGRRALVSTATKSLQDQLFLRDLPRLKADLKVPQRVALLKGRASYLCLQRLEQARREARLPDRFAVRTLARIEAWSQATRSGDLAEIEGLDDRSPVIPLVTSTRDNCLGSECPRFADCLVVQARREAMAADLVVINHHLFFADLALRDSGVAELLPTVDAAVFDEAHQLVDAGLQFLGTTLGTAAVTDIGRDLVAAGLAHARGAAAWQELAATLELAARDLLLACAGARRERAAPARLRWEAHALALEGPLAALGDAARAVAAAAQQVEGAAPEFGRLHERAQHLASLAGIFGQPAASGRVRWIDLSAQSARLVESPLDIREMLTEQRRLPGKAWIFTSATLGDDDGLSWFTRGTGLEDARLLRVDSPFDYAAQARLWVPRSLPRPNDPQHPREVGEVAARCAAALGGRTFVLTTTLRVLPLIADALREALGRRGQAFEVLVQGSQPRRALLQQFGDGRARVLLGSQSFWEGIDVPGDALQCVLIDKLPFPPPNDPLVEARTREIERRGGRAFDEFFVAETAISLKQGGGRLIRTESDAGLLVVCDPRLVQMGYGRRLLQALPPMGRVADEAEAMQWLGLLRATHPDR